MEVTQGYVEEKVTSKFLASVFGYMFIGLIITAAVSFGWSYFLVLRYPSAEGNGLSSEGAVIAIGVAIFAIIGSFIDSLVINILSIRKKRAPWVGFIIYAILMGLAFSVILLSGVSFGTIGQAFALTALGFGIMFLIGYFSPVDLSPLAFAAFSLLLCLFLVSAFFGIWFLFQPSNGGIILLNYLVSIGMVAFCLLITCYDAYRIGKIAQQGAGNRNIALFCAFSLYCDFIVLFLRILMLLLLSRRR